MKKGIFTLLFAIILVFAQMTAFADMIYEPMDDDFYASHRDDCEYINRGFLANGEKGFVEIQESPENDTRIHAPKNGEQLWIRHIYTDKKEKPWGYVEDFQNPEHSGWVDMQGMLQSYDNIAFYEEHKAAFQPYQGELDAWIDQGGDVAIYSFPGSDSIHMFQADEKLVLTETYTDSEGRLWGYFGYYCGRRQNWVCISDPANAELPVKEHVYEELIPAVDPAHVMEPGQAADPIHDSKVGETTDTMWIAAAAVGFVVVLTAVLILRFWKKSTS